MDKLNAMTLKEVVDRAWWSLEDHSDAVVEWLENADDLTVIRYFYQHDACDYFAVALHRLTDWPIVSLSGPKGFLHRLNQAPDGRLVDASGWTDLKALAKEFGIERIRPSEPGDERLAIGYIEDLTNGIEADLAAAVATIRQLPYAPFSEPDLQKLSRQPLEAVDYPLVCPD